MKHLQAGFKTLMLAPATAATAVRTANLDISGVDYVTFDISVGVELNTNSTNVVLALLESDDTTVTNFATFNAAFNTTIDNASATSATWHVDTRGRKKLLRVSITPDTTTNGPVITGVMATTDKDIKASAATNTGSNVVVG